MADFEKSILIHASVAEVFAFHERPDALELLTPPFPPVKVVSRSGGIRAGARVELRVLGLRWVALHTQYEKDRLFVDEQIEGPFRKWVHRHEFLAQGGQCLLTDRVHYETWAAWAIRPMLDQAFRYRHQATLKALGVSGFKP